MRNLGGAAVGSLTPSPCFPESPFYTAVQSDFPGSAPPALKRADGIGDLCSNPQQFCIWDNTVHPAIDAETVFKDIL